MPWSSSPIRAGVKMWRYEQTSASTMWQINHGMGVKPIIEVQVPNGIGAELVKAYPKAIVQIDDDNVEIQWSTAKTGVVTFLAPP